MFSKKQGFVYILSNDFLKENLLKIGMTTRTPEDRARELYETHTGVPGKFEVIYHKEVENCEFAEDLIHRNLSQYRVNEYREFFNIPLQVAIKIIEDVCQDINDIAQKKYQPKIQPVRQPCVVNPKLPPTKVVNKLETSYSCKVCNKRFGSGSRYFNYSLSICDVCANSGKEKEVKRSTLEGKADNIEEFSKTLKKNPNFFPEIIKNHGYNLVQNKDSPEMWTFRRGTFAKHVYNFQDLRSEIIRIVENQEPIHYSTTKSFAEDSETQNSTTYVYKKEGEVKKCYYCKKDFPIGRKFSWIQ